MNCLAFILAIVFNLFMMELLVREKLGQLNRLNSPFGTGMSAALFPYNQTNQILNSSVVCNDKLDCMQSMCLISNLPSFNSMKILLTPAPLHMCNLTIEDSIKSLYTKWEFITIIILNGLTVLSAIIGWIFYVFSSKIGSAGLFFTFVLYIMTACSTIIFGIDISRSSSTQPPFDTTGTNLYDRIHTELLLSMYAVMTVLFIVNFIMMVVESMRKTDIPTPHIVSDEHTYIAV